MNTSALRAALQQAAVAEPPRGPVYSPLRALGRRRLTPFDLVGQSMATVAPASCMVFTALSTAGSHGIGPLAAIVGATLVMVLVALCIRQFTTRLAAAGSLYSFVAHGLGPRATLTAGAALLVGYLGVSVSVLSNAGADLAEVIAVCGGPRISGMLLAGGVALVVALIAIRGVLFATRLILIVEVCSVIVILALLVVSDPEPVAPGLAITPAPFGLLLLVAMHTVINLAGFESAAFFGPEARRPLHTITGAVLFTPAVTGTLYIVAAWAGASGQAGMLVNAYFGGTATGASPMLVAVVNIGVCSSCVAATLGFAQAGSRLLYSMSLERVVPSAFARVHPRFRTPYVGAAVFVGVAYFGALWHVPRQTAGDFSAVTEIALLLGYTLVAFAALRFLSRIGEHTTVTRTIGIGAAVAGSALMVIASTDAAAFGAWTYLIFCVALGISGSVWFALLHRYRPTSIAAIGVFDSVATADLLPGSASLRIDAAGKPVLTAPGR